MERAEYRMDVQEIYRRLDAVGSRLNELSQNIAVMTERNSASEERSKERDDTIDKLESRLAAIERVATKYSTIALVVCGIAVAFGGLLTKIAEIAKFFGWHG